MWFVPSIPWNNLGLSLSRPGFKDRDVSRHQLVSSDRVDLGQGESRCFEKCFPFTLAAFFAAGDGEHVEVAHQPAFELRIGVRDERGQDEFNDQQTAVGGNNRADVSEKGQSILVLIAVQNVFDHVDIGAWRDGLLEIGDEQIASVGWIFLGEARSGCLDAGFEVDEHAAEMGVEAEHGKNERTTAAAEVGDHFRLGEIPGLCDGSVIFGRSGAHDGAKDRARLGVLGPARRDFGIADLGGGFAGSNAVGQQGPAIGEQVSPEDDGSPDGVGYILAQRFAKRSEPEVFGGSLLGDADAGEGAEEAVEGVGIRVTFFGQKGGAAFLVCKGVGNAKASGGA